MHTRLLPLLPATVISGGTLHAQQPAPAQAAQRFFQTHDNNRDAFAFFDKHPNEANNPQP